MPVRATMALVSACLVLMAPSASARFPVPCRAPGKLEIHNSAFAVRWVAGVSSEYDRFNICSDRRRRARGARPGPRWRWSRPYHGLGEDEEATPEPVFLAPGASVEDYYGVGGAPGQVAIGRRYAAFIDARLRRLDDGLGVIADPVPRLHVIDLRQPAIQRRIDLSRYFKGAVLNEVVITSNGVICMATADRSTVVRLSTRTWELRKLDTAHEWVGPSLRAALGAPPGGWLNPYSLMTRGKRCVWQHGDVTKSSG